MNVRFLIFGIILLTGVLRLWGIDKYPAGFTPDEASFGYDAYSILKTGKDQWGETLPLSFRSFGDFKAPLYTYLTIPSIAIFGLTEFAVRLPNAVLGTLAVLVTYLLVAELFKRETTRNPTRNGAKNHTLYSIHYTPYIAALLLAISPWHISLSRGAFEANLTTFLMPLGIYAFLRGIREKHWMIVSAVVFGLNLFSYHSAKLVTPLLIVVIIWMLRSGLGITFVSTRLADGQVNQFIKSKIMGFIIVFSIFLALSFFSVIGGSSYRAGDIGIFNPTGGWGAVSDRRYEAVLSGLPDSLSRIFSNKFIYTVSEFIKNYLSYFSPTFLFTQGAGEATYGMIPGYGVLYLLELPFLLVAIWAVIKKPNVSILLIIVWLLLSPIPTALTKGPGFAANRLAIAIPAIQILSAYGGVALWQILRKYKFSIISGYWVIGILGVFFFLEAYLFHGPKINAPSMSYGWREAMGYISGLENKYQEIVISRTFSEPHIFVAFYQKWDPADYQKQSQDWRRYEMQKLLFVDQLGEWKLGKYTFRDIKYEEDQNLSDTLLVGRSRDFPENIKAEKKILYPNNKAAFLIIDPLLK